MRIFKFRVDARVLSCLERAACSRTNETEAEIAQRGHGAAGLITARLLRLQERGEEGLWGAGEHVCEIKPPSRVTSITRLHQWPSPRVWWATSSPRWLLYKTRRRSLERVGTGQRVGGLWLIYITRVRGGGRPHRRTPERGAFRRTLGSRAASSPHPPRAIRSKGAGGVREAESLLARVPW
jgi:hypothetical protein